MAYKFGLDEPDSDGDNLLDTVSVITELDLKSAVVKLLDFGVDVDVTREGSKQRFEICNFEETEEKPDETKAEVIFKQLEEGDFEVESYKIMSGKKDGLATIAAMANWKNDFIAPKLGFNSFVEVPAKFGSETVQIISLTGHNELDESDATVGHMLALQLGNHEMISVDPEMFHLPGEHTPYTAILAAAKGELDLSEFQRTIVVEDKTGKLDIAYQCITDGNTVRLDVYYADLRIAVEFTQPDVDDIVLSGEKVFDEMKKGELPELQLPVIVSFSIGERKII